MLMSTSIMLFTAMLAGAALNFLFLAASKF